ncbi:pentapeptide repeat-containing protein [Caenispirillum bisanense]|nr:pentapeptide repeat-containing protein [Caenispirillum bisanense]
MATRGQTGVLGRRFEKSGREGVDFSDLFPAAPHGSVSGLPADDLRQLVLESSSGQAIKDIRIKKAVFNGNVHLEHVSFGGYLRFEDCRFKGKIDLRHARLRRLKFVNCVFEGVVEADVAVIEGDVDFERCDALKGIAFPSAAVEGRFVFSDTTIRTIADTTGAAPEQTAFDGGMLSVKKGLFFRKSNSSESSLNLEGTVDLRLSTIGGDLDFDGAVVSSHPRHPAIDGSNCSVSGLFSIRGQCQFSGRVDLYGACLNIFQIKKSTVTVGEEEQESAIYAHCSRLTGSFTLGDDAILDGVDLTHSRVGGAFQFGSTDDEPYSEEQVPQGGKARKSGANLI